MMRFIIISIAFITLAGCASTYTETREAYYYASYPTGYPLYYPTLNTIYKTPMYYDTYFGGPLYPGPFQYGNYGYSYYDFSHYYSKQYRYQSD